LKKYIEKILNKFGYEKKNYLLKETLIFKEYLRIINPLIIKSEAKLNLRSDNSDEYIKKYLEQDIFNQIKKYIRYDRMKNPSTLCEIIQAILIIGENQI